MERLPFELEADLSGRAWPIAGNVYVPSCDERTVPVIALAHGWLAHRGQGFLPSLAEAFARAGFVAVTFNFSGSGYAAGSRDLTDEARFGANTFAREIDDVERVVTAIFERVLPGRERFDIYRIGLCGHDAGASVALIEAARDSRVKAVAGLATLPRLAAALEPGAFDEWLSRGEHRLVDPASGRRLTVGRDLFRDLRERAAAPEDASPPVDVGPAARALSVPYLLVQGEADERVSVDDARKLYFAGNAGAELELLAGAGHELQAAEGDALAPAAQVAALRFFDKALRAEERRGAPT